MTGFIQVSSREDSGFGADPWRVLRILIGGDTGEGILIREKYVNQSGEVRKYLCADKAKSLT